LIHQGKLLQILLREKDISVTELSKLFGLSRRAIYNYFKSETLSHKVSQRFIDSFDIDIRQYLHFASIEVIENDLDQLEKVDSTINRLKKENLQLKTMCEEKDKHIAFLEDLLKKAIKK